MTNPVMTTLHVSVEVPFSDQLPRVGARVGICIGPLSGLSGTVTAVEKPMRVLQVGDKFGWVRDGTHPRWVLAIDGPWVWTRNKHGQHVEFGPQSTYTGVYVNGEPVAWPT